MPEANPRSAVESLDRSSLHPRYRRRLLSSNSNSWVVASQTLLSAGFDKDRLVGRTRNCRALEASTNSSTTSSRHSSVECWMMQNAQIAWFPLAIPQTHVARISY